jgi:hypothetical protein
MINNFRKYRICYFIGCAANEQGFCNCGKHEYYDQENWQTGILNIPGYNLNRVWNDFYEYSRRYFRRCYDCHKLEVCFGKYVGNHDNCIPF